MSICLSAFALMLHTTFSFGEVQPHLGIFVIVLSRLGLHGINVVALK